MLRWLKKSESVKETGPGLPSSASPLHETINQSVEREYNASPCSSGKKRKRGEYSLYSPEQNAKMVRYAIMHGNSKAASHLENI